MATAEPDQDSAEIDFATEFGIPLDAPSGQLGDPESEEVVDLGVLTIREYPTDRSADANQATVNNAQAEENSTEVAVDKAEAPADIQLDKLSVDNWWQWVDVLPLAGFTQSVASNLVLTKVEDNQYFFDLDPEQSYLFNKSQEFEIEQALRAFDPQASVHITVQPASLESPAERSQRLAADSRVLAQQALESDTLIQRIVQEFDAQIIESTIRPVA